MKKLLIAVFLSSALFSGMVSAEDKPSPLTSQQATQLLQESKPVYSCGMKTDWFSDKPGQCPCCTMDLEKVKEIKDGKAVFEDGKQTMPMNGMDMKMMEKK